MPMTTTGTVREPASIHTQIVSEIIHEVLAETERTYDNAYDSTRVATPSRQDYVTDVIAQLQNQLDSGFWAEADR